MKKASVFLTILFFTLMVFSVGFFITVETPAYAEGEIIVTAQPTGGSFTYGSSHVLQCEGECSSGEISYAWYKNDRRVARGRTYTVTDVSQSGVYFCRLTAEGAEPVDTEPVTVTVSPVLIDVRVVGLSDVLYTGAEPTVSCELIAPPAGVSLQTQVDFNRAVKDAGDYVATLSFDNNNYRPAVTDYPFTVGKAPLTIGVNAMIVCQGETVHPVYYYRGFIEGEDESVLLSSPRLNASTSHTGVFNVTPYGAEAKNYDISYDSGVLQVDKTGVSTDFGEVTGAFDPNVPLSLEEGGDVSVGLLNYKTFSCTVDGQADRTYTVKISGVTKYPKIFLRGVVVDADGNRYDVRSFSINADGELTYSADHAGVFVLYYNLVAPAVVIAAIVLLALILLIVKAKDRKKYKRWHNREKTAHSYVRSLQRRLTQEDEE